MAQEASTVANDNNLSLTDKVKVLYGAPANMTEAEEFAWLRNTFEEVYGPTIPFTDAEAKAWQSKMWDEHYDENARDTLTKFWVLLAKLEDQTAETHGEDGTEYKELTKHTASMKVKLRELERNLQDPAVKQIMEPLRDVWVQYAGGANGDKQRGRPIDETVIRAFGKTTSLNL